MQPSSTARGPHPVAGSSHDSAWTRRFVSLALALSWAPWGMVLLVGGDPGVGGSAVLWALGGLGPMVAAVLAAAASDGRAGIGRLGRGLLRWRVGRWYLLLLAGLPVGALAVLGAVTVGPATFDPAQLSRWLLLPVLFLSGVVAGGLEEIGWRGYLLPRLQGRHSALAASVLIGLVWSAWHAPLFLMEGTSQASASVVWFSVQAVALSVVLTWAYNSTGGSLLLAVLAHGSLNAWYSGTVLWLAPDAQGDFVPYASVLLVAAAAGILWRYGPDSLSGHPRQTWPPTSLSAPGRRRGPGRERAARPV